MMKITYVKLDLVSTTVEALTGQMTQLFDHCNCVTYDEDNLR